MKNLLSDQIISLEELSNDCLRETNRSLTVGEGEQSKLEAKLQKEFELFLGMDDYVSKVYLDYIVIDKIDFVFDLAYFREGEYYFVYFIKSLNFKTKKLLPVHLSLTRTKINILMVSKESIFNFKMGNFRQLSIDRYYSKLLKKIFSNYFPGQFESLIKGLTAQELIALIFYKQPFNFYDLLEESNGYKEFRKDYLEEAQYTCVKCNWKSPDKKGLVLDRPSYHKFGLESEPEEYQVVCKACRRNLIETEDVERIFELKLKAVAKKMNYFAGNKFKRFKNTTLLLQTIFIELGLNESSDEVMYPWVELYKDFYSRYL